MADQNPTVPVWTLATEPVPDSMPDMVGDGTLTPERLADLRAALATFTQSPVATLEMHTVDKRRDPSGGIALRASSPLAQHLSQLVTQTGRPATTSAGVTGAGETLYRMVVPAKFAPQVRQGLVSPMASKAIPGGIHGALRGSKGIVSTASFVPVGRTGTVTAGAGIAAPGVLTVAAPLVLMAVAVGASAAADRQQRLSIEKITDFLEAAHQERLEAERNRLDGCRDAVEKATSVLLDHGKIGQSLGLDSASHEINTAIAGARTRLAKWQDALDEFGTDPVDLTTLTKAFPGILSDHGDFQAQLETARLAIALKRRVLVLQAVEHAQMDEGANPFRAFLNELGTDEQRLNDLETRLDGVLLQLSTLDLKRPNGLVKKVHYKPSEVDRLLDAARRLRNLGAELDGTGPRADVSIDIERRTDGSVVVFPATPVEG